jgi:cell division protein FtsB
MVHRKRRRADVRVEAEKLRAGSEVSGSEDDAAEKQARFELCSSQK